MHILEMCDHIFLYVYVSIISSVNCARVQYIFIKWKETYACNDQVRAYHSLFYSDSRSSCISHDSNHQSKVFSVRRIKYHSITFVPLYFSCRKYCTHCEYEL